MERATGFALKTRWRFVAPGFPLAALAFGTITGWWGSPMFPIAMVAFCAYAVACWRMELRCSCDGLVVCNGLRAHRIAWTEVAVLRWQPRWPWGPAVVVSLHDGREIVLGATQDPFASADESAPAGRRWIDRLERCRAGA